VSVIHDTILITTRTTMLSVRGGKIMDMGFMEEQAIIHGEHVLRGTLTIPKTEER